MPASSENLYDDAPAAAAGAAPGKPEAKEGDEGGDTFIVPKSAFGGREVKPGDKCDITIKAVHENDVECSSCASGDEDEEQHDNDNPELDGPAPAPSEMGGMME